MSALIIQQRQQWETLNTLFHNIEGGLNVKMKKHFEDKLICVISPLHVVSLIGVLDLLLKPPTRSFVFNVSSVPRRQKTREILGQNLD